MQLFIPRLTKRIVDGLSSGAMRGNDLFFHVLLIVFLGILIAIFRFVWRNCLMGTSRKIERGLRDRYFSHLLTLDAPFFDRNRTGDLMSRATNDISNVRMAVGMGLVAATDALLLGSAAVACMIWISLPLTLLCLIPMPFIVLSTRFLGRRMHRHYTAVQEGLGDMTEMVRESFSGIRVVKVFNMGDLLGERLGTLSEEYLHRRMALARSTGLMLPTMLFFANLAMVVMIGAGGSMVVSAEISPGDFVAFLAYLGLLTWPMMAMGWMTNLLQRGRASLERLAEIFTAAPSLAEAGNAQRPPDILGSMTVSNLSFRFRKEGPRVLRDLSIRIPARSRVGITGPPGSGKSVLLQLLVRLYDPDSGSICLDGLNLKHFSESALRRHIHYMPQEPWIFSGTLRENIAGLQPVSEERMKAVCEAAMITEMLSELPLGLETTVGEKGIRLSGGQKQRVTLARTLLSPASVLLLDDPVSQVDTVTAGKILAGLDEIRDVTRIVASHRFSAIIKSDIILVMDEGRIRAAGNHEHLMQEDTYYAKTARIQAMELELEEPHGFA